MDMKQFENPSPLYRNAPFWSWNDRLNIDELKRQMDEMIDKGWGSFFMHSRVGLVTGYLSEEWMEAVNTCAAHAKETGAFIWLYDEDKWPSGFAGGIVPEKSEKYRSKALVLLKNNELTENDTILKEINTEDGRAYICYRADTLGDTGFNGASYVDLMNPETVREFLQCTHEQYKKQCGECFGKEIKGVFTDEPCYNIHNNYKAPVVPWSDYLPDFFMKLKGYDIRQHLEKLFYSTGDYRKIRFDFYDAATRLYIESFSMQYYQWCDKNNLKLTGHYMAEDNLISQTQWTGAAMPHYKFMHWPGIDKCFRNINQLVTVKQLTSAADQLGKERTLCEAFAFIGQQSSFLHRKWITDWQAVLGISFVNSHISHYSMRGERKRDYPPNLFIQQPWWEDERKFADYTARLSYLAVQGRRAVDILLLHPIASAWSEYSPLDGGTDAGYNPESYDFIQIKSTYDKPFNTLSNQLIASKLDFHYGDEILMEENARVEGDKLIIGCHSYSTVVVPPMLTLRAYTLKLLKDFAKAAGPDRIIFISRIPDRIDGIETDLALPEDVIKVKNVTAAIQLLDSLYKNRVRIIDLATGKNAEKVICQQRITEDGSIFLIANTDHQRKIELELRVIEEGIPQLLDLMSGETYKIPCKHAEGKVTIQCTLHPAGSFALSFGSNNAPVMPVPAYLGSGIEFEKNYEVLGCVRNWNVKLMENNVIPLNKATLYVNGEKLLDNRHVSFAWHEIFYKLPDGTPFKAEYTFDIKNIPDSITVVIEVAENLKCITLNGKKQKAAKQMGESAAYDAIKSWKDINFTKVPLEGIIAGKNILVLEGEKVNNITGPGSHCRLADFKNHRPTELEAVYLVGCFSVIGEPVSGFMLDAPVSQPFAADLTLSGYPFYAGKAEFSGIFEVVKLTGKVFLKLSNVEAASVKVFINGLEAGTGYFKPWMFDISKYIKAGANKIRIEASTTLFNLMGPNWISDIENNISVGPGTFIDFSGFTDDYKLLPFGIGMGILLKCD